MTGPEHYREAEKSLMDLANPSFLETIPVATWGTLATSALAHATLAQAAATIDASIGGPDEIRHEQQWREVLS